MGLAYSAFSKFGLPTGKVYDMHFEKRKTDTFPDFHIAYLDFCKYFNTVMPGQDFYTPPLEEIKKFYEDWEKVDEALKKEKFIAFMKESVSEAAFDDSLFIMAGLAAPAAAIFAKKSSESIPQVKKFRVHLFPDVVFVPLVTLVAIMGATAVQMTNKKSKDKTNKKREGKPTP